MFASYLTWKQQQIAWCHIIINTHFILNRTLLRMIPMRVILGMWQVQEICMKRVSTCIKYSCASLQHNSYPMSLVFDLRPLSWRSNDFSLRQDLSHALPRPVSFVMCFNTMYLSASCLPSVSLTTCQKTVKQSKMGTIIKSILL